MTPPQKKKIGPAKETKVTLKTIAQHLGLTAGTVSAALNNSSAARSIPEHTKRRIRTAAKELNYRPNFFASCSIWAGLMPCIVQKRMLSSFWIWMIPIAGSLARGMPV